MSLKEYHQRNYIALRAIDRNPGGTISKTTKCINIYFLDVPSAIHNVKLMDRAYRLIVKLVTDNSAFY